MKKLSKNELSRLCNKVESTSKLHFGKNSYNTAMDSIQKYVPTKSGSSQNEFSFNSGVGRYYPRIIKDEFAVK